MGRNRRNFFATKEQDFEADGTVHHRETKLFQAGQNIFDYELFELNESNYRDHPGHRELGGNRKGRIN
jgi:hypothetical protein